MDFVWSRVFGTMRVTVISEGTGWWSIAESLEGVSEELWRPLIEADRVRRMPLGFNLVHIASPTFSLLCDAGMGPVDARRDLELFMTRFDIQVTPGLEAGLAKVGTKTEGITHVLISHLHDDHIVGATRIVKDRRHPTFQNAQYFVMESEWANMPPAEDPMAGLMNTQKRALVDAGVVRFVRNEEEIAPGITFVPAPGETPGHAIVRVAGGGEVVYYLGDLFHNPAEILHPDWLPIRRNREQLIATRKALLPRFAAENAWLIPAHFEFPAIGRVQRNGEQYVWKPVSTQE